MFSRWNGLAAALCFLLSAQGVLVASVALFGCATRDPHRIIIESREECAAATKQPFEQSVADIRSGFVTKVLQDPRASSVPSSVLDAYLACTDRHMIGFTQEILATCRTYGSINKAQGSEIAYRRIFKPCQAESEAFQAELRERQTKR
jgi:hypothetical protein